MTKSIWGRNGFLWLKGPYHNLLMREDRTEINQNDNLEACTEAETMIQHSLQACFLDMCSATFLTSSRTTSQG